jgi:mycothiol synthase
MLALEAVPPEPELDARLAALADQLEEDLTTDPFDGAAATLREAVSITRRVGATACVFSAEPADESHDAVAARAGMHATRELLQLRRPLPVPPSLHQPEDEAFVVRPFVPGDDDATWIEVNNRAFAWHPEQGGWTEASLRTKLAEPWFDAEGFLVHEVDGRLAGFCWTKVHQEMNPPVGEIFVIAVDPDLHQRGLGRRLLVAGLDWLASHGQREAMLYVEADNVNARALYDALGFLTHHTKRWWRADHAS